MAEVGASEAARTARDLITTDFLTPHLGAISSMRLLALNGRFAAFRNSTVAFITALRGLRVSSSAQQPAGREAARCQPPHSVCVL